MAEAGTSNTLLSNAIKKYGSEAFTKEVLYTSDDIEYTLSIAEEQFIREYKTHFVEGYGYNMTFGGEGHKLQCSQEHKDKLQAYWTPERRAEKSQKMKGCVPWNKRNGAYMVGDKNPMFGKNHSSATIDKISQAKIGKQSPRKGITLSSHTKSLCRAAHLKNSKTYEVTFPNDTVELTSRLKDFCLAHNLNLSHMIEVANGKQKHHKGYQAICIKDHPHSL